MARALAKTRERVAGPYGNRTKYERVVITMGCRDACPIYPGKRYEDWELDDPAGRDLETVRRIRDDLDQRVAALLRSLSL